MAKRKQNIITSRAGVNFLRNVVENTGSIFNEIHQENDVGIDAIVEFFSDEQPVNKLVAFQVKSGASYYDIKNEECKIPVEDHYDYWINYSLPVYGLVYVPVLKQGYWIDIKRYLKQTGEISVIKFKPKTLNTLTEDFFISVFIPFAINKLPNFTFDDAYRLTFSTHKDEVLIGLAILFKNLGNENKSWDRLIEFFINAEEDEIPYQLIYYFAHIPWHPDMHYYNESYTDESKAYAKTRLSQFGEGEILKLISFIDEENLIARGTPGQSVQAIVSIIDNKSDKLLNIIKNDSLEMFTRAIAAILYAYTKGPEKEKVKGMFDNDEFWFVHMYFEELDDNEHFILY